MYLHHTKRDVGNANDVFSRTQTISKISSLNLAPKCANFEIIMKSTIAMQCIPMVLCMYLMINVQNQFFESNKLLPKNLESCDRNFEYNVKSLVHDVPLYTSIIIISSINLHSINSYSLHIASLVNFFEEQSLPPNKLFAKS